MIVVLKAELDKLYEDFEVIKQAREVIGKYVQQSRHDMRVICVNNGSARSTIIFCPANLDEIVEHFGPTPNQARRDNGLKELLERVTCDFMNDFNQAFIHVVELGSTLDHAIKLWSIWDKSAITKGLQEATHDELIQMAILIGGRTEDQGALLEDVFEVLDAHLEDLPNLASRILEEFDGDNEVPLSQKQAMEVFDKEYAREPRRGDLLLEALKELRPAMIWEMFVNSPFFKLLPAFENFVRNKDFEVWRKLRHTPMVYFGYKAIFDSFHDNLMHFPVIARQVRDQEQKEQE